MYSDLHTYLVVRLPNSLSQRCQPMTSIWLGSASSVALPSQTQPAEWLSSAHHVCSASAALCSRGFPEEIRAAVIILRARAAIHPRSVNAEARLHMSSSCKEETPQMDRWTLTKQTPEWAGQGGKQLNSESHVSPGQFSVVALDGDWGSRKVVWTSIQQVDMAASHLCRVDSRQWPFNR